MNKIVTTCVIFIIFQFQLLSQSEDREMDIHSALIQIAQEAHKTLIFNTITIPNKRIIIPHSARTHSQKLDAILTPLNLSFEFKDNQILIYKIVHFYGYVEDASSKERLIHATIEHIGTNDYTIANENGFFSLTCKTRDSCRFIISYLGYKPDTVHLPIDRLDRQQLIRLKPNLRLNTIIVTDNMVTANEKTYYTNRDQNDLILVANNAISSVGGEPDLFQSFMRQTEISTGADGIGGLHIRGGKADQNLVLYEGVKIYNPSHAFGLFSIFNTNIIQQARFTKFGSNEEYSGRLSSTINMQVKSPDLLTPHIQFQSSSLASQLNIEYPLINKKIGILASIRRSHIDPYLRFRSQINKLELGETGKTNFYFYDINTKLKWQLNSKNQFYLTLYHGADQYKNMSYFSEKDDQGLLEYEIMDKIKWNNLLTSFQWHRNINSSSMLHLNLFSTSYNYASYNFNHFMIVSGSDTTLDVTLNTFKTNVKNWGFRIDLEKTLLGHYIKLGFNGDYKKYQPGFIQLNYDLYNISDQSFDEITDYIDALQTPTYSNIESTIYFYDRMNITRHWLLESSLYFTYHSTADTFNYEQTIFLLWHGYFKTNYRLSPFLSLGAQIGKSIQTDHLLTTGDAGFPNDIWVPSTSIIGPESSYQFSTYLKYQKLFHKIQLTAYHKRQFDLLMYNNETNLPSLVELNAYDWDTYVFTGQSKSKGISIDYQYSNTDKYTLHLAYTWSQTRYTFDSIQQGRPFNFSYDTPHNISLGSSINLGRNIYLSIDWQFYSGRPITLYQLEDKYLFTSNISLGDLKQLSTINGFRLSNYHKLSLTLSKTWLIHNWTHHLSVGIQNIYNQQNNILAYEIKNEGLIFQKGFPIFPNVKYFIRL